MDDCFEQVTACGNHYGSINVGVRSYVLIRE